MMARLICGAFILRFLATGDLIGAFFLLLLALIL